MSPLWKLGIFLRMFCGTARKVVTTLPTGTEHGASSPSRLHSAGQGLGVILWAPLSQQPWQEVGAAEGGVRGWSLGQLT